MLLSIVTTLGLCGVSVTMLFDLRADAWQRAGETADNLVRVIEQDLARNVEVLDLSLQGVVEGLARPDLASVGPELRNLVLFDRAATAKDIGAFVVFDEKGDLTIDSTSIVPRKIAPVQDRDYFKAHEGERGSGLFISQPYQSRLIGVPVIGFSRRVSRDDGSFAGVALGTLRISYLQNVLDQMKIGRTGVISITRSDGAMLVRKPHSDANNGRNIGSSPTFQRMIREGSGRFVATSVVDGTERLYAFRQVGTFPLVLSVALTTNEIFAEWWRKASVISLIVSVLCATTIGLTVLFRRELGRRSRVEADLKVANAELAQLAVTDALTGLYNRRYFDDAFDREWRRARRTGLPLSMLIVDADQFKRYNDWYGHQAGDGVLKAVADCIRRQCGRAGDAGCRIGGEEFGLLLPETRADGALEVAERIRRSVQALAIPHIDGASQIVTVSVGVATVVGRTDTPAALFGRADAALYGAKENGRNRVFQDGSTQPLPAGMAA